MIITVIDFALSLSCWLGLSALVVVSQWRSLCPILRFLFYIPFGFLVALCTPGPVTLGNHLAC